jgi:Fe-S-cluster containining protein
MFIGFGDPGKRGFGQQQEEQVAPGWTERDVLKGITHLYGMMSRAQETSERENGLPCKAGCSWCCENVTVLLTHAEWMVVLQYLKVAEPKLTRKLLRRALVDYKKNKETIEQITADQENAEAHATGIEGACPMLLEDGLCGIYEARPHDCRMYGCSFMGDQMFACHLVLDAVAGKSVTAPDYEASARILGQYPRTDMRQTFAYWARHQLPEALRELALSQEQPAAEAEEG